MAISKIESSNWQTYLDSMSKGLGREAEIEIDALSIGSQIEAEWLPLLGISYDKNDDAIDIILEGLDHRITHPTELYVDQIGTEIHSLEVLDGDNARHIIKLRGPLMLPAP
jgi:hypothetical protein